MATGRITIRVDKRLQSKLAKLAKSRGETESEVVRAAIEKLAVEETPTETCYDLFKRSGAIGIVKGAPRDLSTNPKYLEGLGRD